MSRENFGSKLGILAAAAGSAVGLGNIWKFPYIVGKNGGAAFILVYLLCIALIGIPVMVSEFALGRNAQANAVEAFKAVEPKKPWYLGGYLAVATAFIILSFYSIIAGWVFSYFGRAVSGQLGQVAAGSHGDLFGNLIASGIEPMILSGVVLALTAAVCIAGVKSGIEKVSKILMPMLVVLLLVLMGKSLTLEGAQKGLDFLFKPDFSLLSAQGVLEAVGHAFYSLSLGMGIILTYGSYIGKKENLPKLAMQVTVADTAVALMAGVVIFPAVFAFGFEPGQGPGLIFVTLPAVFEKMAFGSVFAALFFLLVGIAAITSTISLMEVVVTFSCEQFKWSRVKATLAVTLGLFALSVPSNLSFGIWSDVLIFGKNFFDLFDFIASNVFLPFGGILVCLFVGRVWTIDKALFSISNEGELAFHWKHLYAFSVKWLAPIAIFLIFLSNTGLLDFIKALF